MVLKIQLDGKKLTLTGAGSPLITFIDGVKKRLTKGITFVNGQKKVLWDVNSLKIEYIPNLYALSGNKSVGMVFVNKNNLVLSSSDEKIIKYNIANITSPRVESSVAWGNVCGFSLPDSTDDNLVFYADLYFAKTFNQLNINPNNCNISVSNTRTNSVARNAMGIIGGNWLSWAFFSTSYINFHINDTTAAAYGYIYKTGSVSVSNFVGPFLAKINSNTFVGTQPYANTAKDALSVYTATELQPRITGYSYDDVMVDTNGYIACAGPAGFGLYSSRFEVIRRINPTGQNRSCGLVGKIRDFYYVVDFPISNSASDKKVYLLIFNSDTGSLFEKKELSLPQITDWTYAKKPRYIVNTMPQVSKNGMLGFVWTASRENTVFVRIQGY